MYRLDPHPEPPCDLAARPLPLRACAGPFFRIHRRALPALHFGRGALFRFDAPGGEFGVLYAALEPDAAFIETLGHATGLRVVDAAALMARGLVVFDAAPPLQLVDLSGQGLAQLGADNRLADGDYLVAQRWSRALHDHPAAPDGIAYRCRHDPERLCVALFERVAPRLSPRDLGPLWGAGDDPSRLAAWLERYEFGLIDD